MRQTVVKESVGPTWAFVAWNFPGVKVGNSLEDSVVMGLLAGARRLEVMDDFVTGARNNGAEVTPGGERIGNRGFFYALGSVDSWDSQDCRVVIQCCLLEAAMGVLDRLILRDDQWERISPHIIGDARTRGSSGRDNRMFVEAALWIVRTGATCPKPLATGTASSAVSAAGATRVSGGASSPRCRTTRILNI